MIELHGIGVSSGIAIGRLAVFCDKKSASAYAAGTPEKEWEAFLSAQEKACADLSRLAENARAEAGEDAALLFETHCEMAQDPDFCDHVSSAIAGGADAPSAVFEAGARFAAMFEAMDDDYMKNRATDISDVAKRICRILRGETEEFTLSAPAIVVAEDVSPSQTMALSSLPLLGLVTRSGSAVSHTAILSRLLSIPAVVGLRGEAPGELNGITAILDGEEGSLIIDPDGETVNLYERKKTAADAAEAELSALVGEETATVSGQRLRLYCNIAAPEDVKSVTENGGEGIGLFRSEFLFLGRDSAPGEDEQLEVYKTVLSAMGEKSVTVRTVDIGADKKAEYLGLAEEENPALGLRGLRLSLAMPDLFKTQLRALYRASVYGRLSIMFPMVSSLWELRKAKEYCDEVKKELKAEGISYSGNVRIGVMIETPAAALISAELAENADFFSLGTNDLTQYTLACDRQNALVAPHTDPHHPAILALIKTAAENAHKAGIPVGICGELAADESMTEYFLSIGIDELSVSPAVVLPLRRSIRGKQLNNINI